ncbi:hypothetical protein BIT28_24840 [Photobacterium proteolyticum]|uniref:Uncharacterized protein n=1 Tax=Photobacterium proteolyticum TaxID=1903952 RepID=A0A1Q9GD07_9GAMM|nr:hypothetical protein [Photobacterium proteolyticum]OLQ72246.1 hypothetical protein BIT28_24840 [Photobacterium proteolyticum]
MSDLYQFHAHLELQHIFLEANAERFHHLSTFIDGYYCYRHQLVTRQGKADWTQIFEHGIRSKAASQIADRKKLVREPRLPFAVLTGKLKVLVRDDELNLESLQSLLDDHLEYTVLTREEFQRLKAAGLTERMPAGYYCPASSDYQNTDARFEAVGIEF